MDKNKPKDEELKGFRTEAATLLGIAKPPLEERLPKKTYGLHFGFDSLRSSAFRS
jgi:hypothetical protein